MTRRAHRGEDLLPAIGLSVRVEPRSSGGGGLNWKSSSQGGDPKLLSASFAFNTGSRNSMTLIVPTWAMALVFAVLPTLWVYSKLHKKGGKKKKPEGAH